MLTLEPKTYKNTTQRRQNHHSRLIQRSTMWPLTKQKVVIRLPLVTPHPGRKIKHALNGVRERQPFRSETDDEACERQGEDAEQKRCASALGEEVSHPSQGTM
jgi:hypothetical protein